MTIATEESTGSTSHRGRDPGMAGPAIIADRVRAALDVGSLSHN